MVRSKQKVKKMADETTTEENVSDHLISFCKKTGYEITQANGQRIYSAPNACQISPAKGCEIFIGRLPKNLYEKHIIPILEKIGKLYNFRLMLDFCGKTRGYAFAIYFTVKDANEAVERLNGYEICPGSFIGVYKSVDNCRLFIGNIPLDKTKENLLEMLQSYCDGVVNVIMYRNYANPTMNRGFAFAEFENHRLAAMARRQLSPHNLLAWGKRLFVDWAEPIPEVHPSEMAKVKILYLKNLPSYLSSQDISVFINGITGGSVVKVCKMQNFCFVHFIDRQTAKDALSKLQGLTIDNYVFEVEWARPRTYSRRFRQEAVPENFCTSLPLRLRKQVKQRIASLKRSQGTTSLSDSSFYSNSSYDSNLQLDFAGVNQVQLFSSDLDELQKQPSTSKSSASSGEYSYFGGPYIL